jgi:glycosyltransferase involved in cell wall biosynthesis
MEKVSSKQLSRNVAIDLRMIESSGIGTYLKNLIPLIITKKSSTSFKILGRKEQLKKYSWTKNDYVEIIQYDAPIYSFQEQIDLIGKIPKNISLFWVPHYNIPLFYSGKLLVTVHDVFHLAMPQFINGLHRKLYAKFMFKVLSYKANRVITVSDFTKSELLGFINYPNNNIYPIHNGITRDWFHIEKTTTFSSNPYLIYVGNVKPHKNLVNLIKAFFLIMDKLPHDLIIIGKKEGFLTGDLQAVRLAENIKRVKFTGYIDDNLLKQYIANAEALIFTSLYEGFGLPPLEAMACGCPVIASNVASIPEVCSDAVLYCNPYCVEDIAEKIQLLVNNTGLKTSLRAAGIERAKKFSWEKCADATISVIDDILISQLSYVQNRR